jgi:uncharacterized protein (UPF0276 family)
MEENSYQSASGMEASGNGEGPLFAVNYSNAAAELFRRKRIDVDLWKCPAWPDVVSLARESRAVYVHFPLLVGSGGGDAIDTETQQPADWDKVESLLAQTGTPWVNLHLGTRTRDYPELPADTTAPDHVKMLAERMTRDVQAVVDRFGAERVIVENVYDGRGMFLRPCLLGENIRRVVENTGCGFLLDLSHARLAAHYLGIDARAYIATLPVQRIREMHVTGIQPLEGRLLDLARQADSHSDLVRRYAGHPIDHMPMTDRDWAFFRWAMDNVHRGDWRDPWLVAFECGGVHGIWEAISDERVLAEQIPRLRRLVRGTR